MKTCRLCLMKSAKYINIFEDDSSSLISNITTCCKLQIYKNDRLPENICNKCFRKLNIFVQFITQCGESDKLLRNKLNENFIKIEQPVVKDEPISEYDKYDLKFTVNDDRPSDDSNFSNEPLQPMSNLVTKETEISSECVTFGGVKIYVNRSKTNQNIRRKKSRSYNRLCPVCGKYISKGETFKMHLNSHGEKSYPCSKCPKLFQSPQKVAKHMIYHSEDRKFKCEFCEKAFKTNNHAKVHMESMHIKSKSYPCSMCEKKFGRGPTLKKHYLTIHMGERDYECHYCFKKFAYKNCLELHLRTHTGERPFACQYCESKFAVIKSLKEHERIHTGERPFVCPVCSKAFYQKGNMKSHFRHNHKGPEFESYKL